MESCSRQHHRLGEQHAREGAVAYVFVLCVTGLRTVRMLQCVHVSMSLCMYDIGANEPHLPPLRVCVLGRMATAPFYAGMLTTVSSLRVCVCVP